MSLLLALTGGGGGGPATVNATGSAGFGGLSASTTARVTHSATGSATFGGLTSTTTARVTHSATGTASLGAASSSASATVTHPATGTATLGTLTASTTARVAHSAAGAAPFGTLTSATTATGGTAAPVDETGTHGAVRRRRLTAQELKLLQPKRLPRIPNMISASAHAELGALFASTTADALFDFHIDDEELLLLV